MVQEALISSENLLLDRGTAEIKIKQPTLQDLDGIVALERLSWKKTDKGMVATKNKFITRIDNGLMHIMKVNQKLAGIITFQNAAFTNSSTIKEMLDGYHPSKLMEWKRISQKYCLPKNWYKATNDGKIITKHSSTHNPNSDCVFLVGVAIDRRFKGYNLVNRIIQYTLIKAKKQGIKYAIGYARLPELWKKPPLSIQETEQYLLERKTGTSLPKDFGARFHAKNGGNCVAVIPDCMNDADSQNYGFLVVYDLSKI